MEHVARAVAWGLRTDMGGRQWAEPFEAEMAPTEDLSDLASYTVCFGDTRGFPEQDSQTSLARIGDDLTARVIDWAFVFRRESAVTSGASCQV